MRRREANCSRQDYLQISKNMHVLQSNFKIAWRQFQKNKLIAIINIFGLGVGLAVGIFILIFFKYEMSYESAISEKENIYLQNFAYQQTGFWLVFVGVGLATLGIVFLTVSLQSLKAAMSNPVDSIRID